MPCAINAPSSAFSTFSPVRGGDGSRRNYLLCTTYPTTANATANSASASGDNAGTSEKTATDALLVLFAGFDSLFAAVTVAVFVNVPCVLGSFTTSVIVACAAIFIAPRVQMTVDVPAQLPCVGVAETKLVPAGIVSVTTTFAAIVGPLFVTAIVYVTFEPPRNCVPFAVLVMLMSVVPGSTTTPAVALPFAGFGSAVTDATNAELLTV